MRELFVYHSHTGTAPRAVKKLNRSYPGAPVTVLKEPCRCPGELQKIIP